ncbi:MAG: hypothetical protein BV459_00985 [Thermoplasmata archaeon M11B2D]|nr:MAG: hypothetical protein BV459_00985 [Thermoplasmata archaeon M11B2D]PNX53381.1 MAG: hypothetical protein BV458_04685 [Thermoplasmata archaeon M9B2D]
MSVIKNRLDTHVEKTENLVKYLLKKRKESIQNSLIRPLYQEAAKSLFVVVVLLLDTLIPLEVIRGLPFPFNLIGSLLIFIVFLYIEVRIYNKIWGKNGRWSVEKYTKQQKQGKNEKKDFS